jgi:phosphatidylinositol-3-phosphatase
MIFTDGDRFRGDQEDPNEMHNLSRFARRPVWPSLAAACLTLLASGAAQAKARPKLPPVGHVFVIVLENQDYASTFGDPLADPYLASTLPKQGALLKDYYGTGHHSNDDYISLVSGQPPTALNQLDCPTFVNFTGSTALAKGVEPGNGCVYPANVANIGTQLSAKGLSWKAYEEDMGNDPMREAAACGHPAVGSPDNTEGAEHGDGYATRHDPFVYFHSVIDSRTYCDKHVVALGSPTGKLPAAVIRGETGLATDLKQTSTTPALSFITPNLCNDGHDYPCINQTEGASAPADIDSFLQTWVPRITHSPAYRKNGLLEITFDESEGPTEDSSACCHEPPGPAAPKPGIDGPGGGKVGAVLLSPFIQPRTVSTKDYNHYSSLATWELLFGLRRLADAATVPTSFGSDVFTNPKAQRISHPSVTGESVSSR